jgi:hypothetical protein
MLLWDPKGSVVATDANAPRRRVYHPDGTSLTARGSPLLRKPFCISGKTLRLFLKNLSAIFFIAGLQFIV